VDVLLSIWEEKGLEDAVFAFQDCILNGTPIKSVEDTDLTKPKAKKKKSVNSFMPVVFDNDILDTLPVDVSEYDVMDDIDLSDVIDLSDLIKDE
jgi:hypothetical protein